MPKFEVQTHTICDGWVNTWTTTDDSGQELPEYFDSFEDAHNEIEDFIISTEEAYLFGYMEDRYFHDDFKIVEVGNA
jgi:hypothetical protein